VDLVWRVNCEDAGLSRPIASELCSEADVVLDTVEGGCVDAQMPGARSSAGYQAQRSQDAALNLPPLMSPRVKEAAPGAGLYSAKQASNKQSRVVP
jgi:hypothetical protein